MRVRRDAENLFESSLRLCHWIRPESRFTLKAHLETEHKFIDKSRGGWSTKTHLFAVDARTAPGTLAWAGHDAPAARLSNWPLKWGHIPVAPPPARRINAWEYERAIYKHKRRDEVERKTRPDTHKLRTDRRWFQRFVLAHPSWPKPAGACCSSAKLTIS